MDDLVLNPAKIVTQGGAGGSSEGTGAATSPPETMAGSNDNDGDDRSAEQPSPPVGDSVANTATNGAIPAGSAESRPTRSEACLPESDGERHAGAEGAEHEAPPSTAGPEAAAAGAPPTSPRRGSPGGRGTRRPADDDPLSNKESSEWAALWSDKELMQAIDQDVIRTMPDLAFYACRGVDEDDEEYVIDDGGRGSAARREQGRRGRERREALARILFVHAKLNPAESYTQGMNEIVATLYFVLATEGNEEWHRHCEADTFFCFTNLMAEIRDVFIQSLDDSESGLHGKSEGKVSSLGWHTR